MKAFLQTIPYMAVDLTCIQSKALMIHDNTLIKYTSIYLQNCFQCKRLWCWALNNITPTNKRREGERERKISQRRCRWWKKSKFKQNLTRFFRFVVWTHFELVISKPKSNLQQFSQTETKRIFSHAYLLLYLMINRIWTSFSFHSPLIQIFNIIHSIKYAIMRNV